MKPVIAVIFCAFLAGVYSGGSYIIIYLKKYIENEDKKTLI